ncbi:hypothetical protein [Sphingopyxis sp. PET50]|uniref:hypothetical protein n=1 Tax=Sphingopyxis sp. PET50 TaxID=2976533 RepID=UPI0021AFC909|nr:hypothetical protein [Sphingopyxis sp. PET50]
MTPLERAARALCLADGLDPDRKFKSSDWSEGTAPHEFAWHEYLPKARAVLTAIREPSEGMREAGAGQLFGAASDDWGEDAKKVWVAMIEAALTENGA